MNNSNYSYVLEITDNLYLGYEHPRIITYFDSTLSVIQSKETTGYIDKIVYGYGNTFLFFGKKIRL